MTSGDKEAPPGLRPGFSEADNRLWRNMFWAGVLIFLSCGAGVWAISTINR